MHVRRRGDACVAPTLPKAELHVHLEGSIRPATLLKLARRHHQDLPADDEASLSRWFEFKDFAHFVEIYLTISSCLVEPEDFYEITLDFLAEQARQNVVWSEVHFTISTHLANGGDGAAIHQALTEAADEGLKRWGVRLGWIPDIVRNAPLERADHTLEWMAAHREPRATGALLALGLGGMEHGYPPEPFAPYYDEARKLGFHTVAHAGEHGGPESIWGALDVLGAERIGHGVSAIRDPVLVAELARRRIPVEACPSSNVCLGAVASHAQHPLDALRRAGVPISLHSDDPPLFSTTLLDEYDRVAQAFGYGPEVTKEFIAASFEQSFLPEAERVAWVGRVGPSQRS